MNFSPADFEAVIDKVHVGMDDICATMDEIPGVAQATIGHWYVPGFVADAIRWLAEKMIELARKILDKVVEVLRGVAAPVLFFGQALELDDVAALADGVEANLAAQLMVQEDDWSGAAASAYRAEIGPQRQAVGELGSIAESMKSSLRWAAYAGLAFYAGVGLVVAKLVAAMVAALVALGSVVLSWAGAALVVEEAGVGFAALGGLVGGLAALLGDQVRQMDSLRNSASSDNFPYGAWPTASA